MSGGDDRPEGWAEAEALRSALADARNQNAGLRASLAAIEASTSWRVTAPLRRLVGWFRKDAAASAPAETRMRAPEVLPDALLADMPGGHGDESYRLVDGTPWLAHLVPEPALASYRDEPTDPVWRFAGASGGELAVVASRELARELAFEAPVLRLDVEHWREQLTERRPEWLLIEADPRRVDPGWQGALQSPSGHPALDALLSYCRTQGIPTVVWLRMEPVQFPAVARWIGQADRVYAVDDALLRLAVAEMGAARVGLLPPAIQPRLHNPVVTDAARDLARELGKVVLCEGLSEAVETRDPSNLVAPGMLWADGYWDVGGARVASLVQAGVPVVGHVAEPHRLLLSRLVGAEFMASRNRPAWWSYQQMLRAAACGALVGTSPAFVADTLPFPPAAQHPRVLRELLASPLPAARLRQGATRIALRDHALGVRLTRIRQDLGLDAGESPPLMSCLLVSRRPGRLPACIAGFARQRYPNKELIVVVHGDAAPSASFAAPDGIGRLVTLRAPSSMALGDCLNLAFAHSGGAFWAKLDDDDHYGPDYLVDLMLLAKSVECDLLGKPLVFSAFERDASLYYDPHRAELVHTLYPVGWPSGAVCGATLAGRREVLERVAFPGRRRHGADSDFLKRCASEGLRLLAGDAFQFACRRSAKAGFHTWEGEEGLVRSRGVRIGDAAQLHEVDA